MAKAKRSKTNDQVNDDSANLKPTDGKFLIVGLGASAGGVQAFHKFFHHLPPKPGMAFVVILHLSPDHDSNLAQVLQTVTKMPVTQVKEKTKVEADHVYVVSPNQHLTMSDGSINVTPNTQIEDRRAPVDIFFRTLGEEHGSRAIAVVLSGTGANGSMGLKRVKEKGGATFVQNPREAEFNEMPRNAIATGLVDEVLNVADIPAKIIAYGNSLGKVQILEGAERRPQDQQQALREIFTEIRARTGHDFSNYKRPTLLRRIERRINIHNLPDLPSYVAFMHQNPDEIAALLKDLLISVTNFFRDKKSFEIIEDELLPLLLKGKTAEDQLRIWVAGCATGEEAYTCAILAAEKTGGIIDAPKVQIFATDIDEAALSQAREGLYNINELADVSPERLQRFFVKEGDEFRISREVRETIMFANHNFLKDPPFSHLDLVSCRNVMIYLNNVAQERVARTFHFALNPGGFLFLGSSESVDAVTDLYTGYNRENHIFQSRHATPRAYPIPESAPTFQNFRQPLIASQENENKILGRISFGDLHQQLLEQYAAPSLVVNDEYDIVHLSERAGRYLQIGGGELSKNLLKLVKPEFRLELRSALYQATQRQSAVEARGLKVHIDDHTENVNIHVRPVLRAGDKAHGFILVLFEPSADASGQEVLLASDEPVARQLEEELVRLKGQLRSSSEQHEFQQEELKASNEELQANYEELRSAAEELETSKEELQSINEELRTVNQELKVKIEETSLTSNNLQNLINSTDIGTIFLDRNFRVALFTPAARSIFNLIPADYGRPLSDITNRLEYTNLLHDAKAVLERLTALETEVSTTENKVFLMRISPYRTTDDRINGVVVTFVDITARKEAEDALKKSEEKFRINMETAVDYAIINLDKEGMIESWNNGAERIFGFDAKEVIGKPGSVLFTEEERSAGIPENEMTIALDSGKAEDERWHRRKDGSRLFLSGVMRPIYIHNKAIGFVKIARDMTHQREAEENLRIWEERYRIALQSAETAAWDWDIPENKVTWNEQLYVLLGVMPRHPVHDLNHFLSFVHEDDVTLVTESLMAAAQDTGLYREEFRIRRADNKNIRWLTGYGRAVEKKDGRIIRIVGVMFDITERKQLEQQKEDFISIASHELKTPVTTIKAYTEILYDTLSDAGDKDTAALIEKLDAQVDRLIALIYALLDSSKIAEGELILKPEKFNISDLIRERVDELKGLSISHEFNLRMDDDIFVTADRERIGQVLTNLISNGVKYSPDGGNITIRCVRHDHEIEVSVQDGGIGIAKEAQQKIFGRFFREKNEQMKKFPGMGLGLFVASNIIRKHDGKIWVESDPGKGSVFYFSLPVK